MLTEVYTMEWPANGAELLRKSHNEKIEEMYLRSKNRLFVQLTEQENTLPECCDPEMEENEE